MPDHVTASPGAGDGGSRKRGNTLDSEGGGGGAGGFGTAVGGRHVVDLTTLTAALGFIIQGDGPQTVAFTIPIAEPLPPQYVVRVLSDRC